MWLLNARTRQLESFNDVDAVEQRYAILSHVWEKEEITFDNILSSEPLLHKQGYRKLDKTCRQALEDDLPYVWIDTCCIDKRSSAELSEAINSMFKWYRDSAICYVFLTDCIAAADFANSRWFTRGWTLQELIAPPRMDFYSKNWELLGTKDDLCTELERITAIPEHILQNCWWLDTISVAKKMSWAVSRKTTRPEDIAYCLLGIFDVNIPLLYGEGGEKAFRRLQEAIIRSSTDHSILVWQPLHKSATSSVLPSSPSDYRYSGKVVQHSNHIPDSYELNNAGVRINLPLLQRQGRHFVLLDCRYEDDFSGIVGLQVDIVKTASDGLTTIRRSQSSSGDIVNFDVFNTTDEAYRDQIPKSSTPLLIVRHDYVPNRDLDGNTNRLMFKLWLQMDHRCAENLHIIGASPSRCWNEKSHVLSWSGSLAPGVSSRDAHILLQQQTLHVSRTIPWTNKFMKKWLDTTRTQIQPAKRTSSGMHLLLLTRYRIGSRLQQKLSIKALALSHEPDHAEIASHRNSDSEPWTEIGDDELDETYHVSTLSVGPDADVTITTCREVVMSAPVYVVKLTSSDSNQAVQGAHGETISSQSDASMREVTHSDLEMINKWKGGVE